MRYSPGKEQDKLQNILNFIHDFIVSNNNIVILKIFNKMKLINIMLILLKIKIFSIREKDKLGKSLYKGTFELEISN